MKVSRTFLVFALLVPLKASPGELLMTGKANQVWLTDGSPNVEVRIEPSKKKVSVSVTSAAAARPEALQFIFYDQEGNQTTLKLYAIQPLAKPGQYGGVWADHSPGPPPENAIGFELRIPLEKRRSKVLRSSEFRRLEK